MCFNGAHSAVFRAYLDYLGLLDAQFFLIFKRKLHDLLVSAPIGLRAQRVHGRPFAAVEHAVLYAGFVSRLCHFAAECVKLTHKVPLAGAADGRVARHVADAVKIYCKAYRVKSHACGRKRGFNAGMPCADDGYVAFSCVKFSQFHSPLYRT